LNLDSNLPRFIRTDSIRLKQIIVNLLGNAVKFTESGEVELKLEVLEKKNKKCLIRFNVRDTGIGIKSNKIDKIFQAFTQEDASTTKKYGGTGLGLAITNKLLALMNSKLQLESIAGKGSKFFFELWVDAEDGQAKEWENLTWIKKALIVDDNLNNRTILERMMHLNQISTVSAKNGFEALQFLASGEKFDVVLMDYHMPYMDGLDTIRQIREIFNDSDTLLPIVLLFSSSDDEKVNRACEALKVNARLVKPVKMDDLYEVLSRLLLKNKIKPALGSEETQHLTLKAIKILVADDNPVNMLLAKTIINRTAVNAIVIEAATGIDAINAFKQYDP
ncbi:MAG: response regulator, partial [Pedobacter sp.]